MRCVRGAARRPWREAAAARPARRRAAAWLRVRRRCASRRAKQHKSPIHTETAHTSPDCHEPNALSLERSGGSERSNKEARCSRDRAGDQDSPRLAVATNSEPQSCCATLRLRHFARGPRRLSCERRRAMETGGSAALTPEEYLQKTSLSAMLTPAGDVLRSSPLGCRPLGSYCS